MADGHTHSRQESDHWWGMIGWGCRGLVGVKIVCVLVCRGLNGPMWGLNTWGLTTAERSQGGVDPLCAHTHTCKHTVYSYSHTQAHTGPSSPCSWLADCFSVAGR